MNAIEQTGLLFEESDGTRHLVPVSVKKYEEAQPVYDLVIVLVKSYQTRSAALLAKDLLNPASALGKVLTLQNGYGNLELLQEIVGADKCSAGVSQQAALVLRPGHVKDAGKGTTFLPLSSAPEIADLFRQAGIAVEQQADVDSLIWGKLAINAGINPLSALLHLRNGQLPENPRNLKWMTGIAKEVEKVAHAKKIKLPYKDMEAMILKVCLESAENRSSMLSDVERGGETEIDAICGAVIREGERHGIPTPLNKKIYGLVKQAEAGRSDFEEELG